MHGNGLAGDKEGVSSQLDMRCRSKGRDKVFGFLILLALILVFISLSRNEEQPPTAPIPVLQGINPQPPSRNAGKPLRRNEHFATKSTRGYVLTLKFTGQQVAGLRGLFSQQCWLNSFHLPMSVVEPFMQKSLIINSVDVWEREKEEKSQSLSLNHFYNLPQGMDITSWNTFLREGHRDIILVTVEKIYSRRCLEFLPSSCAQHKATANLEIPSHGCKFPPFISEPVSHLKKMGFRVVRNVCLDCSLGVMEGITPDDILAHVFGDYKPEKVTLLISQWKFSFRMSPNCGPTHKNCISLDQSLKSLQPSPALDKDADHYFKLIDDLYGSSRWGRGEVTTTAIMVRLEWFVIKYKLHSLKKVQNCLENVRTISRAISYNSTGGTRVVIAMDIGKYGSGTYDTMVRIHNISTDYINTLISEVKNFISVMYDGNLTFETWEESFVTASGGNKDRGYIAALQSSITSKADCLVLMGGGHFQELARQQYLSRNPQRNCVHVVDVC